MSFSIDESAFDAVSFIRANAVNLFATWGGYDKGHLEYNDVSNVVSTLQRRSSLEVDAAGFSAMGRQRSTQSEDFVRRAPSAPGPDADDAGRPPTVQQSSLLSSALFQPSGAGAKAVVVPPPVVSASKLDVVGLSEFLEAAWRNKQKWELEKLLGLLMNRVESTHSSRFVHKKVWVACHGETEHGPSIEKSNEVSDRDDLAPDQATLDPRLSATGRQQAAQLRERLVQEGMRFDVVVVCPLMQSIETAHVAFEGLAAKFVLSPEHTEMAKPNQDLSCLGKDWSEVEQEFPFVTEWDRSLLIEGYNWKYNGIGWTHPLPAEHRVAHFTKWLKIMKAQKVAVVGPLGILSDMLAKPIESCELVEHEI
mmetsp:Transcript_47722/g.91198  ORF Transcript_47722/g.91198 Transcript_47722/m.91198 type:complete len:365 (+) Transcript_47722:327-1421(+)|eukprot:CAMPEP_0114262228 /NCGR_PEP_ID=MMETSP0058-20121206/21662_1 /TAXON_ID=36894 /ORGANISM="Pyramimonas parkeae, CCMP726" /LENGTH=364 /DNA_ID=CAMNT_0001378023 /DNA_START=229 /DNA_END=1323 /DNA_ORIENTATION=+